MAKPIQFKEQTAVYKAPPDMGSDCEDLHVFRGSDGKYNHIISCWELDEQELAEVAKTGKVWVSILGMTQPPIAIMGSKPILVPTEATSREEPDGQTDQEA